MSLEIGSQISSICSALFALVALFGIRAVYRKITNKQNNENKIVVNGQAHFEGSFNVSNKVNEEKII